MTMRRLRSARGPGNRSSLRDQWPKQLRLGLQNQPFPALASPTFVLETRPFRLMLSCLFLVVCCLPGVAVAHTIALGDSITGRIRPHAVDSLLVTLRDGDYARLAVTHPTG